MRDPPSENLRSRLSTFHSMSVGGRLVGLLKKISYSIFSRRSCESRIVSSSSVVTEVSRHSLVIGDTQGEVPFGHHGAWYGGNCYWSPSTTAMRSRNPSATRILQTANEKR